MKIVIVTGKVVIVALTVVIVALKTVIVALKTVIVAVKTVIVAVKTVFVTVKIVFWPENIFSPPKSMVSGTEMTVLLMKTIFMTTRATGLKLLWWRCSIEARLPRAGLVQDSAHTSSFSIWWNLSLSMAHSDNLHEPAFAAASTPTA